MEFNALWLLVLKFVIIFFFEFVFLFFNFGGFIIALQFEFVFCAWRLTGLWDLCWGFSRLTGVGSTENLFIASWALGPDWTPPTTLDLQIAVLCSPPQQGLGRGRGRVRVGHSDSTLLWVGYSVPYSPLAGSIMGHLVGSRLEFTLDSGSKYILTQ